MTNLNNNQFPRPVENLELSREIHYYVHYLTQ